MESFKPIQPSLLTTGLCVRVHLKGAGGDAVHETALFRLRLWELDLLKCQVLWGFGAHLVGLWWGGDCSCSWGQ